MDQLLWDSFLACFNGVALVAIVVFLIRVAKYLKSKKS